MAAYIVLNDQKAPMCAAIPSWDRVQRKFVDPGLINEIRAFNACWLSEAPVAVSYVAHEYFGIRRASDLVAAVRLETIKPQPKKTGNTKNNIYIYIYTFVSYH